MGGGELEILGDAVACNHVAVKPFDAAGFRETEDIRMETLRDEPLFPDFPLEEFEVRWRRARELMADRRIDVLLLTNRENVEYFSGYRTIHWHVKSFAAGVVFFPRDGSPTLLVPGFMRGTASKTSWIRNLRWNPESHSDMERFPRLMVETLESLGMRRATIGIERGLGMVVGTPLHHFEFVRENLPEAHFEGAGDVLWQLREIKSQREIAYIRKACELSCRAYETAREAIRPGMEEVEVALILKREMADLDSDPTQFVNLRAGSDRYNMSDTHPQHRVIKEGDMMVLDAGVQCHSYWSDIARVMYIGSPTDQHRHVYRMCVEAYRAALNEIRAGAPVERAYRASRTVLDKGGFGRWQDMVGHGVGLDLHEPPSLDDRSERKLQEGMTLCVEPWINLPELGVFALEDMIEVTDGGYKYLAYMPYEELWQTA